MDSFEPTGAELTRPHKQILFWTGVGYGLMVLGTIAAFLLIRSYGETLLAPTATPAESLAGISAKKTDALLHVLLALAAVMVTGQVLAKLFAYLSQPPVIGEVLAGILLGPSLLGQEISALILPPSVAPFLGVIAQIGVILYMFTVGLELNLGCSKTARTPRWRPPTRAS